MTCHCRTGCEQRLLAQRACTGELGVKAVTKHLPKAALVVVKSVARSVEDGTYVQDHIAGVKHLWVTRPAWSDAEDKNQVLLGAQHRGAQVAWAITWAALPWCAVRTERSRSRATAMSAST